MNERLHYYNYMLNNKIYYSKHNFFISSLFLSIQCSVIAAGPLLHVLIMSEGVIFSTK